MYNFVGLLMAWIYKDILLIYVILLVDHVIFIIVDYLKGVDYMKKKINVSFIISLVCILLLIGLAFYIKTTIDDNNQKIAESKNMIAELKGQLKESQQVEALDTEVVSNVLSSAHTAGVMMADLQNGYKKLNSADREARVAYAEQIDVLLEENSKNARVPWLLLDSSVRGPYDWHFKSSYAYTGDVLGVVWLCHPKDDASKLVAVSTADYNSKTGLFSNVDYGLTGYGQQFVIAAGDTVDFNDIVDSIGDGNTSAEYVSGGGA